MSYDVVAIRHRSLLQLIVSELIRNMVLTFIVISAITFILVVNVRMALIVVLCVAFTIINVIGYAHFSGLTIEIVTSMILIMAVGLALDYSAHIAVAFITSSKPTRTGQLCCNLYIKIPTITTLIITLIIFIFVITIM